MMAVPALMPNTEPEEPMVATPKLPLLHAPPVAPSNSVIDAPTHPVVAPVIVPTLGDGFIVTGAIAKQLPIV